jgi:hypothetical protein
MAAGCSAGRSEVRIAVTPSERPARRCLGIAPCRFSAPQSWIGLHGGEHADALVLCAGVGKRTFLIAA